FAQNFITRNGRKRGRFGGQGCRRGVGQQCAETVELPCRVFRSVRREVNRSRSRVGGHRGEVFEQPHTRIARLDVRGDACLFVRRQSLGDQELQPFSRRTRGHGVWC